MFFLHKFRKKIRIGEGKLYVFRKRCIFVVIMKKVLAALVLLFHICIFSHAQQVESYLVDAVSLYSNGEYKQAKERLETLSAIAPKDDAVWYYLALSEAGLQDFTAARKHLEQAISLDRGNFWYRRTLAPKMMALCLRYMGNREDAEDVLQEGFITLFKKLDSYTGAGSFEGWARKIFVNTALMHLRKTDALSLGEDIQEARGLFTEEATPVQKMGYAELMRMIGELPPDARTVFNMYVLEGYSHKEIAKELGCTEATSRSKLQRARIRLQEMIKEKQ